MRERSPCRPIIMSTTWSFPETDSSTSVLHEGRLYAQGHWAPVLGVQVRLLPRAGSKYTVQTCSIVGIPSRNAPHLGSWCFLGNNWKFASLFPRREGCVSLFDYLPVPHGWASNKAACSGDSELGLQAEPWPCWSGAFSLRESSLNENSCVCTCGGSLLPCQN